jgi:hypothetical protein
MSAIGGARGFDLGLGLVGAGSTPFSNTGEEPLDVMVQTTTSLHRQRVKHSSSSRLLKTKSDKQQRERSTKLIYTSFNGIESQNRQRN